MIKPITFYLPQFHPDAHNDLWWGKGFTEWRNVVQSKSLFPGHFQPKLPADLGFYDLRLKEIRAAQANLALTHKIYGFAYWWYWFSGERILDLPLKLLLQDNEPDIPFCISWANETWQGRWHGLSNGKVLIKQEYPLGDATRHAWALEPYIAHSNYIRHHDRSLFIVKRPFSLPNDYLFRLREAIGYDLYIVGEMDISEIHKMKNIGLDAFFSFRLPGQCFGKQPLKLRDYPEVYDYNEVDFMLRGNYPLHIPVLASNWDNTPRCGNNGLVLQNGSPENFGKKLQESIDFVSDELLFIKSWNEWAEGNYLEPDLQYGLQWLKIVKNIVG